MEEANSVENTEGKEKKQEKKKTKKVCVIVIEYEGTISE